MAKLLKRGMRESEKRIREKGLQAEVHERTESAPEDHDRSSGAKKSLITSLEYTNPWRSVSWIGFGETGRAGLPSLLCPTLAFLRFPTGCPVIPNSSE